MRTYQDLEKLGKNDIERGNFCRYAVNSFMESEEYKNARSGEAYYSKHNETIERFQKFLYSLSGRRIPDLFSANYKLKTLFFRRLIIQQVQYVIGNGVTLQNKDNKEKLGRDFDYKLQTAAKKAMASGRAFGFWNYDHLEVFGYADTPSSPGFCPLYDEDTGELRAGIRYWFRNEGKNKIFRATLYEDEGYTEYIKTGSEDAKVMQPRKGYKIITKSTEVQGIDDVCEENYSSLPIVCLYANDTHESELVGIRENIDCYDFIKSGLANDIDDTSGFYWILKNEGGMKDVDLAKFIQRMKSVHAAAVDGDEASIEAHTLDVPYDARKTMLELLRKDIYEDFQALDVNTLSAAQKTAQEIQAAYQSQDNKCADFEYNVIDFVQKILELAGIDDEPTFVWNKVTNQNEALDMVLKAAAYLSDECIIKHLPFLTPEEADEEIDKREKEQLNSFNLGGDNQNGEGEEGDGETGEGDDQGGRGDNGDDE